MYSRSLALTGFSAARKPMYWYSLMRRSLGVGSEVSEGAARRGDESTAPWCHSTPVSSPSFAEAGPEGHGTGAVADAEDEGAALQHHAVHVEDRDAVCIGQPHEQLRAVGRELDPLRQALHRQVVQQPGRPARQVDDRQVAAGLVHG